MSFVRLRHIIFQYIQVNCDLTLTMKLPWFLLNLVRLFMTNIQAVKLWPLFGLVRCTYKQRKRASRHWRHSSMTSFFIVDHFTYEMAYRLLICGGFLGEFDLLNVDGHCADPKRHFLPWLRVIWVIVRKNPPKDHFSRPRRVREKNLVLYFTYLPIRTLTADWHKFWVTCSSRGRNQLCKVLS